jgi:hypothetical protein
LARRKAIEFPVVFDEAQFAEFVHEKADARSDSTDHFRQHFLTVLSDDRLGRAVLAEICKEKEKSGEASIGPSPPSQ